MSTGPVTAAEPPPLSEPARLVNTIVSPNQTFTDIRRNQSWWAPWVLISIVSLAFVYTIGQKIGWDQIMQNEITRSPARAEQFERLSPEQRQRQMELGVKISKYAAYASPVINIIVFLIIAAVLMAAFNFGFGAEIKFPHSMAVVVYSSLPGAIGALLGIISMQIGMVPDAFNIRNPVASNPAYFMDPMAHKFLYGLASALDVFSWWTIVLLGVGYAAVSKVKRGAAIGTVGVLYVLWKVVTAGFASLF